MALQVYALLKLISASFSNCAYSQKSFSLSRCIVHSQLARVHGRFPVHPAVAAHGTDCCHAIQKATFQLSIDIILIMIHISVHHLFNFNCCIGRDSRKIGCTSLIKTDTAVSCMYVPQVWHSCGDHGWDWLWQDQAHPLHVWPCKARQTD